ncbi:Predicted P-loop ATPase, KAP-like [Flavobacterium gillisiae]|uniref:Predicted P-loop ATPase, KAP-like n=1 Tax=Flavobacterium gillisiae TaxID=150146 RepID=A0A1H4FZ69_9FLAO|nr:P-loop NTPase fold protein [Flavobacterium gillisiae]SEB02381.1 Predicted P-loop ATPase, KAP-like [Flavobacterium gillisiae]
MWSDNETSEDLLGFKVHADLLIDVINDETILPITIGVFGDWGSGKSSILQIIKNEFENEEYEDSLCIYFNGWTFEGYDDAKAALLNSILKELEENKKLSSEVKQLVKGKAEKLWKSINWMRGAGLVMKNIALPAVSAYFSGGLSLIPYASQKLIEFGIDSKEKLIGKLQSAEGVDFFNSLQIAGKETVDKTNAVADFRNDFEDLLESTNFKKLVVIIDDLDRCTPDRIIENLEAVKLFLNVPKTAFLIGADPRIVRHAIELKYKTDNISYNSDDKIKNDRIVSDYLEKLIQIPYNLPKLSDNEVETYLTLLLCKKAFPIKFKDILKKYQDHIKEDRYSVFGFGNIDGVLSVEEISSLGNSITILASSAKIITYGLKGNPRQIKRFLNTYILRGKLITIAKLDNVKLDILAKLMVLEYSNIDLFRELYEWQAKSETNGFSTEIKEIEDLAQEFNTDEIVSKYSVNWTKGDVVNWLNTEPKLADVDLRDYYWISRDQLSDSISASSLLPKEIRDLRTKIINYSSEKNLKGIITNSVKILDESKLKILIGLFENEIQKTPEEERIHLIFIELILQKALFSIDVYLKIIKQMDQSRIPSHLSSKFKMVLKSNPEMEKIITELKKDPKTKICKSLNN